MQTEDVTFYSYGTLVSALWRTPDRVDGPLPTIVQGPGWLGLKDARLYLPYHEALTAAGFAVLIIDYRGFGGSDGDPVRFRPSEQIPDLFNAVTYAAGRDDCDAEAIGTLGVGGSGASNSVVLAALDDRVRVAVAQNVIADGRDWLHRMRREHEWFTFLDELAEDRLRRVMTGEGRRVHPRHDISLATPERLATQVKADVDRRIPQEVWLEAADEILLYRPIDAAERLAKPLMVIAVENDTTIPTDHSYAVYQAAKGPKEWVLQRHIPHYSAYERYGHAVVPRVVEWFQRHLLPRDLVIERAGAAAETEGLVVPPAATSDPRAPGGS